MELQKIKVGLIDNHKLFRQALSNYLANREDSFKIKVDFQTSIGIEAFQNISKIEVDIIIIHFVTEIDQFHLIKEIKNKEPTQRVLVLSPFTDLSIICQLIECGIDAYLLNSDDIDLIPRAIISLHRNLMFESKIMTEALYYSRHKIHNKSIYQKERFNEREIQILSLLWEGNSIKEISNKLHLGIRSVEKYIYDMKVKVKASSQIGLLRFCLQNKIIV
jgi:DNA-binding NarL/FixJ family response regulator